MTEKTTLDLSYAYLTNYYGGNWNLEVSDSKFYWNDDIPLREIIATSSLGHQGYLLVSTSTKTPFLITKAFHGDTLTNLLIRKSGVLLQGRSVSNALVKSLKFYYDPPFNFIIRDEEGLFIDVNDSFLLNNIHDSFYLDTPTDEQLLEDIRKEWDEIENPNGKKVTTEIMHRSGPRYNQTYNTSCEISGCTPVGWACYAGWLKMSGLLPTLFTNSDCWFNDWPTYVWQCETADEECQSVHELIWWLNRHMGTSQGATQYNNVVKGGAIFAKFGNPNIHVREFRNCDMNTVNALLRNYAIMFGGVREWQTKETMSEDLQKRYAAPAGHSLVCHGSNGNEVYVNMGWGEYVESRWYNINSISQRHCFGLYS